MCYNLYTKTKETNLMIKQWRIRYYLSEGAYKTGCPAFTEMVNGDRNFAVSWAQNKLKNYQFKFYDLTEL